ncbi:HET-domain-containing protein [Lepidopterella palustris CBS 459.81]|uniref:HET-domain-containing protein n=1 Tax=Lepidopterella palustris CBS 459.81 TaxID=1314670 RepID=A0A8E2EJV6_9PEZI|nr:HET-domain-containing protein [Lepidopterella palustris CBS 459.81]
MFEFPYTYRYSPLSLGSDIRLLRLMPHKDGTAPIQCQLFDYSLQDSGKRTHLYEALSYVWGGSDKLRSISIDKYNLPVTVNFHTALSRLRDRFIERIIWIDAICINQVDLKELSLQVQLMAKIYSKANRVIIWLREMEPDSEQVFEDIRLSANEESTEHSKKEINQQAILNLLQRPWFQRIWVLQEVAAARHVVIMCGSVEIDRYAFCLGLKSLKLSYTASPELQTLPSVTYLIERAGLRSKCTTNLPERFSLNIRCLPELIDMFHTRKASDVHDKVYALLDMSSDEPDEAGLRPDYEVSWKELFQKLIKFALGKDVSVETSDRTQRAVIKSKGSILGQVSSVRSDDRQNVNIKFTSKNTAWNLGDKMEWTLQASAKSIRERDIICLLQGASKPTIIRLYRDHFAIIVIAVTPLKKSGSFEQLELSKSIKYFPRDFPLVWDWNSSWESRKIEKDQRIGCL